MDDVLQDESVYEDVIRKISDRYQVPPNEVAYQLRLWFGSSTDVLDAKDWQLKRLCESKWNPNKEQ